MSKLETAKEIAEAFGILYVLVGFVVGVLLMLYIVPRTRMINTIPATQECTTVKVYNQSQDFCKEVKDEKKPGH